MLGSAAGDDETADAYLVADQDMKTRREIKGLRCRSDGGRGRGGSCGRGAGTRRWCRFWETRDEIGALVLISNDHILARRRVEVSETGRSDRVGIFRNSRETLERIDAHRIGG